MDQFFASQLSEILSKIVGNFVFLGPLFTAFAIAGFTYQVFKIFPTSTETVLQLLSITVLLFQTMPPLNAIEFVSKDVIDVYGIARISFNLRF